MATGCLSRTGTHYLLLLLVVLLFLRSSECAGRRKENKGDEAYFEDIFRHRGFMQIIPLIEPHAWHLQLPRPTHLPPISSFSMHNSGFTLGGDTGDARIEGDDDFVIKLGNYSGIMCDNPVPVATRSFTTEFTFSIPPAPPRRNYWQPLPARRLSFHLIRNENDTSYGTSIQFDTHFDKVQIGYTCGFTTREPVGFDLDSGNKLHAWIEYQGTTNTVEVRLSESPVRPDYPVLAEQETNFLGNGSLWFGIGVTSVFPAATIYSWNFNAST